MLIALLFPIFKASVTTVVENQKDQNRNNQSQSESKQKVTKTQNDSELARARREKRAFYTLGHIVIGFMICWVPSYLFIMVISINYLLNK